MRGQGGYIGFNRVPAVSAPHSAASGVWTVREAEAMRRAGTWPSAFYGVAATLTSGGGNNSWRWQANGYVTAGIDDGSQFIVGTVDGAVVANSGWRTTGLGVKPSTIVSATFTAPTASRDGSAFNIVFRGANLDNAGTLLTGTSLTTAQVTASAPSVGTDLSVDVTAIVQEIIGRAGWSAGNAIVLYLLGTNAGNDNAWRMSADTGGSLVISYL